MDTEQLIRWHLLHYYARQNWIFVKALYKMSASSLSWQEFHQLGERTTYHKSKGPSFLSVFKKPMSQSSVNWGSFYQPRKIGHADLQIMQYMQSK